MVATCTTGVWQVRAHLCNASAVVLRARTRSRCAGSDSRLVLVHALERAQCSRIPGVGGHVCMAQAHNGAW
jgi:hypothetical protein